MNAPVCVAFDHENPPAGCSSGFYCNTTLNIFTPAELGFYRYS